MAKLEEQEEIVPVMHYVLLLLDLGRDEPMTSSPGMAFALGCLLCLNILSFECEGFN